MRLLQGFAKTLTSTGPMAHVIIKCRVTFGKKKFNDSIKPHSIGMGLVLSTQEEFSLKGTNPA